MKGEDAQREGAEKMEGKLTVRFTNAQLGELVEYAWDNRTYASTLIREWVLGQLEAIKQDLAAQ